MGFLKDGIDMLRERARVSPCFAEAPIETGSSIFCRLRVTGCLEDLLVSLMGRPVVLEVSPLTFVGRFRFNEDCVSWLCALDVEDLEDEVEFEF